MKTLVVYYSLDGNTKEAAEKIAKKLGAEIYELKTCKEMPTKKLDRMVRGGMQVLFGVCPAIEPITKKVEEYDCIILGTPVWAGKSAPAVKTFLTRYNNNDKVKAVFTSSGGGDNDGCIRFLKKYLPSMKDNVALADRNHQSATLNDTKINEFVEKITVL